MNNKEKNTILYYGLGFVSIIIFSFLIAFQSSFERILPLAIILATTLAAFSSLKLGIYGPIYLMMILIPFSQSVTLFSIAGRPVNLGMHTIMVGWIILFTLIFNNFTWLTWYMCRNYNHCLSLIKSPLSSVKFCCHLDSLDSIYTRCISPYREFRHRKTCQRFYKSFHYTRIYCSYLGYH